MGLSYDWDLLRRLLHEVQTSTDTTFKPRQYAEAHAVELDSQGCPVPDLDHLRALAADYEGHLFNGGFIAARPTDQGGNGENFVLTERGTQLLQLLDRQGTERARIRLRLDEQREAALQPEVFDALMAELHRGG